MTSWTLLSGASHHLLVEYNCKFSRERGAIYAGEGFPLSVEYFSLVRDRMVTREVAPGMAGYNTLYRAINAKLDNADF